MRRRTIPERKDKVERLLKQYYAVDDLAVSDYAGRERLETALGIEFGVVTHGEDVVTKRDLELNELLR